MSADEERPLTDGELVALAALAQIGALEMKSENDLRLARGQSLAFQCFDTVASGRVERELRRRGVL